MLKADLVDITPCVYIRIPGAAYARAEAEIRSLVISNSLPFLPTPMGKGLLPDDHDLCVAAARSRYATCLGLLYLLYRAVYPLKHLKSVVKWP